MARVPNHPRPGKLVTLVGVETIVEAEVTMSMLRAYGIYAALQPFSRNQLHYINVVDTDLEAARALLTPPDETE